MYTNMDTNRIIRIVKNLLCSTRYTKLEILDPGIIMECIRLSIQDPVYFTYDGNLYQQTRGLPQGASDSGILATIYIDYILQAHGDSIFREHQALWHKYMDDFLVYLPEQNVHSFLDSQINDIQGTISFLDMYIIRTSKNILMNVYGIRKIHHGVTRGFPL